MIDWDVAVGTGIRWVRPGPQVSLAEARRTVAELREYAAAVQEPVREVTGLVSPETAGPIAVVDRPGWIRANVDGFRVVLEPLVEQLQQRPGVLASPGTLLGSVGPRITGMQMGLVLAFLAGRVLGQYELFLPPDPAAAAPAGNGWAGGVSSPGEPGQPGSAQTPGSAVEVAGGSQNAAAGRLTLVAPNIVMVERELGVKSRDFRLWVCLHEETHRTQFTAVSWLRGYVQRQISDYLLASDLDPAAIIERLRAAADVVTGVLRRGSGGGESLIEAIQNPRQRAILDRLTAVMTLVEGHGDYVMDAAGPQVVPSAADIRARFAARRHSAGRAEQALRRLLGIDLKLRQYAEGARFVRSVVGDVGMAGFNKVWTSPETLPTRSEIANPRAWVERVAGTGSDGPPPDGPPAGPPAGPPRARG